MAADAPVKAKADVPAQPADSGTRTSADLSRDVHPAPPVKTTDSTAVDKPDTSVTAGAADKTGVATGADKTVSAAEAALPKVDLTDQAVSTSAKQLHDALTRSTLGISRPDGQTVQRILGSLNEEQRTRLEKEYAQQFEPNGAPGALRRDMQDKLSPADFRRSEGLLERKDGQTNDAANLKAALSETNPDVRDAQLRNIYKTLTSDQIADMSTKFEARYGQNADAEIGKLQLNPGTKEALDVYRKGSEHVTSEDLVGLARLGAKGGLSPDRTPPPEGGHTQTGSDILKEALSGDSPQAKAARDALRTDPGFQSDLVKNYPSQSGEQPHNTEDLIDRGIRDYVREGRLQLDTIAKANSSIFGNKETVDIAVKTSTPEEQQKFQQGWKLSQPGQTATTPEEKAAKAFYDKLSTQFDSAGNRADAERWKSTLLNNGRETVISDMAKTETDGIFGSSHSPSELISAARNLRPDDWKKLHDGATGEGDAKAQGQAFRTQIDQALRNFAPNERERVMAMLDEKAGKTSFEESQKVGRTLTDSLGDTKQTGLFGNEYRTERDAIRTITGMTKEQAADYASKPEVKQQVDQIVSTLGPDSKLLAQRLLSGVEKTGEPPKLEGVDKILYNGIVGTNPKTALADAETALADPALRARLQGDRATMDPADRRALQNIESSVFSALGHAAPRPMDPMLMGSQAILAASKQMTQEMIQSGRLDLSTKDRLGFDKNDIYKDFAKASQPEREKFIGEQWKPEDQQLARKISDQNGEMRLEDKVRSFILQGSPKEKAGEISTAIKDASADEVTIARNAYAKSFGADFAADVQKNLPDGERSAVRQKLNPPDDGRQAFYDNYSKFLDNRGGVTFSGSGMTLERTALMHQQAEQMYNQNRDKLSDQQRKDLDQLFGKALEEHKNDKEKATQILIDAAITAATVTASGGLVTAAMAARVGAGGAFQTAAMATARGEFDPEKGLGDFLKGGVTTVLSALPGMGKAAQRVETSAAGAIEGNAANGLRAPVVAERPVAPVKLPDTPPKIEPAPLEGPASLTPAKLGRDEAVVPAAAAERTPEALTADGQKLAQQYTDRRLAAVKDNLVANPEKLQSAQTATAEAKKAFDDAVVSGKPEDVRTALERMRAMEQLTNSGNKAIKTDAKFAEKYGQKEGESEQDWMKRAMREVQSSVKSSTDKLSSLQRVQGATSETEGLDQTVKRLKDLEGEGIVTKGKSDELKAVQAGLPGTGQTPELLARAHDIVDNKALTPAERDKQLLDLAGDSAGAERLRKLQDVIKQTSENPEEAAAALDRLQSTVNDRTKTEAILSPKTVEELAANFERTKFTGQENKDLFKQIAGNLFKDNPTAAANFEKTLSDFYKESNGQDFSKAIIKGQDGHYTLLRVSDAKATPGDLKVYLADVGSDGKAVGPSATKNEFHIIYGTPKQSAAPGAPPTGEPRQILQIKYEADGKKIPIYQKGDPSVVPGDAYPHSRSQWAGATPAETVERMRQYLNQMFRQSGQ